MQPVWIGTYTNQDKIRQFDNGIENQFRDIQRDELMYFDMTCSSNCLLRVNLLTGELYKNNNKIYNHTLQRVENKELDYGAGLIQFKSASVFVSGAETTEELLKSVNVGYKVLNNGILYQFILSHNYQDYKTWLEVKVTDTNNKMLLEQSRYDI